MTDEKKQLILAIVADITVIFSNVAGWISNKIGLMIASTVIVISALLITIQLYVRMRQMQIKENLISFLLFRNEKRRFNFLPKIVAYMNIKKMRNKVTIGNVEFISEYFVGEEEKETIVTWKLKDIQSNSSEDISTFYLYNGTDIGETRKATVTYKENGLEDTLRIDEIECNRVRLLCFPTNGDLRQRHISQFKVEQKAQDAFDFGKGEVLFFIPANYGEKINNIDIYIISHSIEEIKNMSAELHEIARKKIDWEDKFIAGKGKGQEQGEDYSFYFNIPAKDIHMDSIYYIILKEKRE